MDSDWRSPHRGILAIRELAGGGHEREIFRSDVRRLELLANLAGETGSTADTEENAGAVIQRVRAEAADTVAHSMVVANRIFDISANLYEWVKKGEKVTVTTRRGTDRVLKVRRGVSPTAENLDVQQRRGIQQSLDIACNSLRALGLDAHIPDRDSFTQEPGEEVIEIKGRPTADDPGEGASAVSQTKRPR